MNEWKEQQKIANNKDNDEMTTEKEFYSRLEKRLEKFISFRYLNILHEKKMLQEIISMYEQLEAEHKNYDYKKYQELLDKLNQLKMEQKEIDKERIKKQDKWEKEWHE